MKIFANQEQATKTKLLIHMNGIISLVIVILIFYIDFITQKILSILIIAAYFIIFNYIVHLLKPTYFVFEVDKGILRLKVSTISILGLDNLLMEMPVNEYESYEIKYNSGILKKKELIIYRKSNRQILKYPPISLFIINDKDIELIENNLKRLKK